MDVEKQSFPYPYEPTDGRENLEAFPNVRRIQLGGVFAGSHKLARYTRRYRRFPYIGYDGNGFRIVCLTK